MTGFSLSSLLWLLLVFWLPIQGFALPAAVDFTTPQGLRVIMVEEKTLPMVHAKLVIRAGSGYEPATKAGLAEITSWLLNEGAGELESKALQEKLDFHGIRLSGGADEDYIMVTMTTLAQQVEEAFRLMGLVVVQPRFDAEPFGRGVEHLLSNIDKREESPGTRAGIAIKEMIFGEHPYSRPIGGSKESVKAITIEDVKAFHGRHFRGPEMVLVVAGDLTVERLKVLLADHFSQLNPEPSGVPPIAMVEPKAKGQTRHIPMDVPQSAIHMGVLAIDRHDPDFFPMVVMNHILGGGGFSSRLMEEIREKRGLTYGVYSYFDPMAGRGPLIISMQTKTKSVNEALSLLKKEIKRMADKGVSEEELQTAKLDLSGSFPLRLDGLGNLTQHWAMIGFYRRGMDFLDRYVERIHGVSQQDVLRVAKRFLNNNRFDVVVVGNKADKAAK